MNECCKCIHLGVLKIRIEGLFYRVPKHSSCHGIFPWMLALYTKKDTMPHAWLSFTVVDSGLFFDLNERPSKGQQATANSI